MKKFTAAQLRKAREIIDQEEAIEYERKLRERRLMARRDREVNLRFSPPPIPKLLGGAWRHDKLGVLVVCSMVTAFALWIAPVRYRGVANVSPSVDWFTLERFEWISAFIALACFLLLVRRMRD
jgi:hypothetical protein